MLRSRFPVNGVPSALPTLFLHLHHYTSPQRLVALSPLALAPVGSTAEVGSCSAEVASGAAQSGGALLVDDRSAGLTGLGCTRGLSRDSRLGLGVALSVAGLAASSAVDALVLDVVLGAAVSSRGAAAVEVAVGAGSGAGYAALGVTANVDLGDGGREGGGRRSAGLQRGGGVRLALGRGAGEGL